MAHRRQGGIEHIRRLRKAAQKGREKARILAERPIPGPFFFAGVLITITEMRLAGNGALRVVIKADRGKTPVVFPRGVPPIEIHNPPLAVIVGKVRVVDPDAALRFAVGRAAVELEVNKP